jgi:hypothetical protein
VWKDKGYGFFRGWMDTGTKQRDLIKMIRHMVMTRKNDSRDVPEEEIAALGITPPEHDNIFIPDLRIDLFKQMSGSYLCGGSREACLAEIKLLLDAFNIRHTMMTKFVF